MSIPEFHASQPTRLVAGSGVADRLGAYAATYGRRALLVVGERHARESGLLDRAAASLTQAGVEVQLVEGVGSDPTASVVDAATQLARAWRADVVVAVGGGSVVDVAKAVATSAATPRPEGFRSHLSGLRPAGFLVVDALPVVALPTLPGSGSETNGTSVIVDDETGRKLSAHSDLAAPRVALLDPLLLRDAPSELVAPGLVDAACHALEAGFSSASTIASDALAEQAVRMLLRLGAAPLDVDRSDWERDAIEAWWATNLAGQALTSSGSIVTHPLAHPLSARFEIRHGEAVAALEGAVIATYADRFAEAGSLARVARWFDVRGADDPDAAARGILTRFGRFCSSLGVRRSLADFGITADHVPDIVRDARASGSRGLSGMVGGEPSADALLRILDLALQAGPTTTAKRWVVLAGAADAG